jgi:Tfp pilus assembly protein PilF
MLFLALGWEAQGLPLVGVYLLCVVIFPAYHSNYHSNYCEKQQLHDMSLCCSVHSNRGECYLQTDQSKRALRDCTKALAQNPSNIRTRWRRVQAFQKLGKRFPAALDLL